MTSSLNNESFLGISMYWFLSKLILYYSKNKKLLSKKIKIGYQNLKRFDLEQNLKNYLKTINSLIYND